MKKGDQDKQPSKQGSDNNSIKFNSTYKSNPTTNNNINLLWIQMGI